MKPRAARWRLSSSSLLLLLLRMAAMAAVAALSSGISGCATSQPGASLPTISAAMALGTGSTSERTTRGRSLFSSRCQRCHALPDPNLKEPTAWPAEVASMSVKSGLSEEQSALISEYLVAASTALRRDNRLAAY